MQEDQQDDRPPLFRSWSFWYALVTGFLVLLIVFFYFFTKYFA
jgi:Mg2+ and Co2+ transporter CorA